jgi:hypothetical protein
MLFQKDILSLSAGLGVAKSGNGRLHVIDF